MRNPGSNNDEEISDIGQDFQTSQTINVNVKFLFSNVGITLFKRIMIIIYLYFANVFAISI